MRELTYTPEAESIKLGDSVSIGSYIFDTVYQHGGKNADEKKFGDKKGDFMRFGFGGSTKYTQSIVKILEDLPARLEEAQKLTP